MRVFTDSISHGRIIFCVESCSAIKMEKHITIENQ